MFVKITRRCTGEGLDEDLHGTTAEAEDEVEGGLLLDVVRVCHCLYVFDRFMVLHSLKFYIPRKDP